MHRPEAGTLRVEGLSFRFAGKTSPSLHDIHLSIDPGEVVLITGPTGCGKSTLLRCLAGLIPQFSDGEVAGLLEVDGLSVATTQREALAQHVGMVLQNPDAQLCASTVYDELAFGLENLRLPPEEVKRRVEETLLAIGLSHKRHARVQTLSGGQKQRLVIGAALAMQPRILLLDEPISQLDPSGAGDILALLAELKSQRALTLVLVEHRIDEVAALVDRVVVMEHGRVVEDLPAPVLWREPLRLASRGLEVPCLALLSHEVQRTLPEGMAMDSLPISAAPLSRDALEQTLHTLPPAHHARTRAHLCEVLLKGPLKTLEPRAHPDGAPIVEVQALTFRYPTGAFSFRPPTARPVLPELSVHFHRGERVALLGANGCGKSTLLGCLAGLFKPTSGRILVEGKALTRPHPHIGLMFQDPDLMLLCETVEKELRFTPEHQGLKAAQLTERVAEGLTRLDLTRLAQQPPQSLSRGQRLRVALGAVLTAHPRILLLDEPTTGQDRQHISALMHALQPSVTLDLLIFATHDLETALSHATRILILQDGRLVADLLPTDRDTCRRALEQAGLGIPPALKLLQWLAAPDQSLGRSAHA